MAQAHGAALELLTGENAPPEDFGEMWDWLRNPLPPADEGIDYQILRQSLRLPVEQRMPPAALRTS